MPTSLEALITTALAGERSTHHEVIPEDFGSDIRRWNLLHEILMMLTQRHRALKIELSGSLEALRKFGLVPGATLPIHATTVAVRFGRTERLGAVRLLFSRAVVVGQPVPERQTA